MRRAKDAAALLLALIAGGVLAVLWHLLGRDAEHHDWLDLDA